jgi:hypothetical protein
LIQKKERVELLEEELSAYTPKPWRLNLPVRDYPLRGVDMIPAMAGAIGKTALVAAFAMAWSVGLGIRDPTFVVENVRLELVVGGSLTLLFSAFLNPTVSPPGTFALLIPLIPLMISAGVHPLPFAILVSLAGIGFSGSNIFSKFIKLNGTGTRTGMLLLFGLLGIMDSIRNLRIWTVGHPGSMFFLLIFFGVMIYMFLHRFRAKWIVIPACAAAGLIVTAVYGVFPIFETGLGLPIIDPALWWNERWGIGFGLSLENFVVAIPFATLVMVMWPVDAMAIKAVQEANYPPEAKRAYMDINATFTVTALRNLIGSILGGAQTAAVWRSFMIPLSIIKRPIPGSALFLGLFVIAFGILGPLIDLATFPPLVWLILLFGVFVPMLETGLTQLGKAGTVQITLICIVVGVAVHPVLGWGFAMLTENLGFFNDEGETRTLSGMEKTFSWILSIMAAISYIAMK